MAAGAATFKCRRHVMTQPYAGTMRVFGYCRVSTTEQADGGVSLSAQQQQVAGYVMMKGWQGEHGLPLFSGRATAFHGWSLTAFGRAQEGLLAGGRCPISVTALAGRR